MKLITWNINGIRAAEKKGLLDYLAATDADVVCLQETKAQPDQIPLTLNFAPGWQAWFHSAERKGYSGTAVYSKISPLSVEYGLGQPEFDTEGRTIIVDYADFLLYNIYFPNGGSGIERLDFKLRFYECFHAHVLAQLAKGRQVVVCGDFNTAHKEIDIARPKENSNVSGFMPVERAFLDRFIASGFVDTFRLYHHEPGQYTWWDQKSRARDRNIGWRLDYFYVSAGLADRVKDAFIQMDVMGSDHCPAGVVIG
ncbi:MAG TPA: exodeoxyribonuclease III [Clostridiales bacterium]|nr:exodeoxyribonuclease III [Clostridiales bacterium]